MSPSALGKPRHSRTVSDATFVGSAMVEDSQAGHEETYVSTRTLSVLSLSLHGFLVGLHVLLIFTRMWGWEHSAVFALKYQTWVSLAITATVTTLGTIYSATLVFLTQKLSARKNLVQWQFLTATHDLAAAWTGIGSAISNNALTADMQTLTNLPYLSSLATVGLDGATLYDVLILDNMADNTSTTGLGPGTAEVTASTFQVDCGYLPNASAASFDWNATTGTWNVTISVSPTNLESAESVIFYSTIPVLDANGDTAPQINPPFAPDGAAQSLQLFSCSHILVPRTGVVDTQTGKLISLDNAGMTRPSPVWAPLNDTDLLPGLVLADGQLLMTPSGFIDAWSALYLGPVFTNYQSSATLTPGFFLSYPDFFMLSDLGLAVRGINNTEAAQSITLASFEASLAKLLASMFWILGHVEASYSLTSLGSNTQTFTTVTTLVKGQTIAQEIFSQARLNSNIVATACGLAASTILLLISLQYLQFRSDSRDGVRIDGTELLHGIWLYRHHPELATLMEDVENPTNENLRTAGMHQSVLKANDDGV
ncbi:hypothetical protein GGX14DRAFT_593755 [Mycena pura]|uniref:Transmembrane protein n=1 Tax=Mycena pura TaxID=153505 RepID=A0AAD6URI9_9AGAR|nr:hypothetical protein GGX14DRAFT_593755 [Mycena pura]